MPLDHAYPATQQGVDDLCDRPPAERTCTRDDGEPCECDECAERAWEAGQESFRSARWAGPVEDVI